MLCTLTCLDSIGNEDNIDNIDRVRITTMKKALTQIIRIQTKQEKAIYLSIVDKQSQLGLSYNQRLFVLVEGEKFGYLSKFKESDKPQQIDISKCKTIIPLKHITGEVTRSKEVIDINFYVLEDKKKVEKKWVLKMATEELAKEWQTLLSDQRQKTNTRRNQSGSKVGGDGQKSSARMVPKSPSNRMGELREEVRKDFGKQKSQVGLPKEEYKNQLYETENKFILSPQQEKIDSLEVVRKLDYDRQSPQIKKKQQQAKRQEQQRLRREKEQLLKKEKELQMMEEKIRQEQIKIQGEKRQLQQNRDRQQKPQQARVTNNNNQQERKQTVVNQNFFNQPRQEQPRHANPPPKPVSPTPSNNMTKSKPKLEGINYSQLVNKVIFSKSAVEPSAKDERTMVNNPASNSMAASRNKKIEQVHDYLFQLEKLKVKIEDEPSKRPSHRPDNLPLELGWTFRYLIKQADGEQQEIVEQFNHFCSSLLRQIVEQFHLPERKRAHLPKYRRQQYFLYEKDDIQFKIGFIGLKEVYSRSEPDNRDSICDQKAIKMLQSQFRNYKTLYQAVKEVRTNNFRVPLVCLCEYLGFVGVFKTQSQFDNQATTQMDKKVQLDLQKISQLTKLSHSTLKNRQNVLILKLNNQFYRELAAQTGRMHSNFDYYFVDSIKNLIPNDVLFGRQANKNNQSFQMNENAQNLYTVRPQLLLLYDYRKDQINQSTVLKKLKDSKSPKSTSNNAQLQKLSQNVLIPITNFIKQLDNLAFIFVHPRELEQKLHQNAINIRYLGLIYQNCTLKFVKLYLMSEIAARVTRALFRKTLQDYMVKQNLQMDKASYSQHTATQIIDFLNLILGSSAETVAVWKILSIHCVDMFNVPLAIEDIQKGYFLHALAYHCGLELDWSKVVVADAFVVNQLFNADNFIQMRALVKGYEGVLDVDEKSIIQRMAEEDPLIYKVIEDQYSLQTRQLPLRLRNPKYMDIFRKYISNFVPPDIGIHRGYKSLRLYEPTNGSTLTRTEFSLKFMQLKWYLKRQRKQKYINCFSDINAQITTNYGDFHPLLSELYEIMCIYHRNNGQYEDAITFSKSSVINMLKVCGATHQKVGECYYQLALCCIKAAKKEQAIVSLQKAKSIFEMNEKQYDISYAHVCLKLGLLFLSESKVDEAERIVKFALSLFNQHLGDNIKSKVEETYEEERVECFEILARCYELNQLTQLQNQLSLQCQKEMPYIQVPSNFQKILKIVLYPMLSGLKSTDASTYINIISQVPLEVNVSTYMKSYERLAQRINEGDLIQTFNKYSQNIKSIEAYIKENRSLEGWKGLQETYERETVNDFISLTEELIYFLGEGFLSGALRDSL